MTELHGEDFVSNFIAGFKAGSKPVTIFQRPDIALEINELDRQIELLAEQDRGEASMGDEDPTTELIERRDKLTEELEASAHTFRIQALSPERVEEIAETARNAAKDKADEAAKKARDWAREQCRRADIKEPKEINQHLRKAASDASEAVIARETGIHTLAAALVEPSLTVDQMRQLSEVMGEGQVRKLNQAFYDVTSADPEASLPKSWRNGTTDEDKSL